MDLELIDKIVLVTGGSKGIGLACATAFAREGAHVIIASRNPANLEAAAVSLGTQGLEVDSFVVDLRDSGQAQGMVNAIEARLGRIDILVNCAGAATRTPAAELTAEHWHAAMDAKYFTYIHAMDAVLPRMAAAGGGVIVNIVGMGGKQANPAHLAGGAANAALMLASAGLGHAFAGKNIRVVAVNPSATVTERLQAGNAVEAKMAGLTPEEALAKKTKQHPMGRFAQPHEVADVVVFLASKRASYVNGAVLSLDGGATPIVV